MGNCCCCSIQIIITRQNRKKTIPVIFENEHSVHNKERSGSSRAFEIVDEKVLELYRSKNITSGSPNSTNRNSCVNSYTNNKTVPMNVNNPTNIRKSFSHPNSLNTLGHK